RELLEFKPQYPNTDIDNALRYVQNVLKKRGVLFVLSDFMASDYEKALKIVGNKHDLTGIRIYDIRETEMPNLGMVHMQDAETGEYMLVNTGSKRIRNNYAKQYREQEEYFT